ADQDKEGSLESVLCIMNVVQHGLADGHHQRPVPFHQDGEGSLVPLGNETLQQLRVRSSASPTSSCYLADDLSQAVRLSLRHRPASPKEQCLPLIVRQVGPRFKFWLVFDETEQPSTTLKPARTYRWDRAS